MGLTLPPGIWHTSQCMPTQCPSWVSPGSCSNPWSWLEGCSQCVHLHWWNRGSCIHLEFQPLGNRHHFSMKFEDYSKITFQKHHYVLFCASFTNLLQVIDFVGLLDVELKDVQDASVDVQHQCRDSFRSKYLSNNTAGIFKFDWNRKLRCKGCR